MGGKAGGRKQRHTVHEKLQARMDVLDLHKCGPANEETVAMEAISAVLLTYLLSPVAEVASRNNICTVVNERLLTLVWIQTPPSAVRHLET